MFQLQEADNWEKPAATTWAAEALLRDGESREFLGLWINSSAVHEAKNHLSHGNEHVITCLARLDDDDEDIIIKTSQTSDHVFISMWEVATHDWSSCESGVRTFAKGRETWT